MLMCGIAAAAATGLVILLRKRRTDAAPAADRTVHWIDGGCIACLQLQQANGRWTRHSIAVTSSASG